MRACHSVLRLAVASALAWSADATAAGSGPPLSDTRTVVAVEIPVRVVEDGRPVRGLTRDDFVVLEGRKKLRIVDFEVLDLSAIDDFGRREDGGFLASAARRRFLFFFDLSFSHPSAVAKARHAAMDLARGALHPADLAAVATYSESLGVELVLGFTPDREQLRAALESLGLADPLGGVFDPLRLLLRDTTAEIQSREDPKDGTDQQPTEELDFRDPNARDIEFREQMRDQISEQARVDRSFRVKQVQAMSAAFEELAEHLRQAKGHKQIVFFSEGFDSALLLGTETAQRQQELTAMAGSGEVWRVDSDERFGSGELRGELLRMLDSFRRSDCTIQAIDIGGLRAAETASRVDSDTTLGRGGGEEGLFMFANETGGELFRNYGDLADAMDDLLDRTSVTYLLVLQPEEAALDGSFHAIEVKLKDGRRGTRVLHRPGYYNPLPYSEQPGGQKRLSAAELIIGGSDGGEIATSVLSAAFVEGDGHSVLTVIEAAGHSVMGTRLQGPVALEVYGYAIGVASSVHDFFADRVLLDAAEVGADIRSGDFTFVGRLDLAPGEYLVRTLIRDMATGAVGLRTTPVRVPAPEEPAVLTPFFFSDGAGVVGWEERRARATWDYPLEIGGRRLVPGARPILPIAPDVPVLLVAYGVAGAEVDALGRLHRIDGQESYEAPIALGDRFAVDSGAGERIWGRLDLSAVPPGEYRLDVRLAANDAATVSASLPVYVQ